MKSLLQRLDAHTSPEPMSGCWLWTGAIGSGGYGLFFAKKGKTLRAHRASYEAHVGPVPAELDLDHRCHNRACVNPGHLRPATRRENNSNLLGKTSGRYSSRFTGVSWHTANLRWQATFKANGVKRHLGYFSTEEAASAAYRSELLKHSSK